MAKATRQEGPRAPLFYCALLIAPAQLALAQSVDVSELERCAALESGTARLACYEALTRDAEPPSQPEGPAAQADGPAVDAQPEPVSEAPAPAPPEPQPQPAEAVAPAASPVAAAPTQPVEAPQEVVPTAPAATAAASAPAVSDPTPADPMQGAGTEAPDPDPMQGLGMEEPDPDPDVITGRVTKVTKDGYGRLIFHFDNGQVWRQTEKRYYPYPKNREFDVTISTGMMGDIRLQVEGAGRRVAIKRLR